MTCIVYGVGTKKALLQYVRELPSRSHCEVWFKDPSVVNPIHDAGSFCPHHMAVGESFVCTNHPKRSWFAKVERVATNEWRAS